jgi:hypothetical protein
MPDYYTDSARSSIWVLSQKKTVFHNKEEHIDQILTCFLADNDSGFHVGQQVSNPHLTNSLWQPLEGEILVSEILC